MQLLELGFPEDDIRHALSLSKWHVDEAAVWLTQHSKAANGRGGAENNSFMLTALEVREWEIYIATFVSFNIRSCYHLLPAYYDMVKLNK